MSLLWIGALQSVARWLELLAFGVYVYDLTQSPLQVTLVTLVKLAPLALFGSVGGALPAWFAARSLYLAGMISMLLTTSIGLLAAAYGELAVWQVMLISFLGGVFWVLDFPVRRKLIGDAVNTEALGRGMGLDTIANNGTRMIGPLIGGLLLQYAGLSGVMALSFLLYVVCFVVTCRLQLGRDLTGSKGVGLLENMAQGMGLVKRDPLLCAVLMVTVIYNLFGFPMLSLVPVLGREELQLSASVIGLLASMEGAGALLGGVLFLRYGRIQYFRKIYVFGVAGGFSFGLVYAASTSAGVMGGALLLVGMGSACFATMQTTLLILNCESRDRSQVFGILSLCIGAGLIGFSQIGLIASWLGPRVALFVSSTLGLLFLALVCWRWPGVIGEQAEPSREAHSLAGS